MIAALRFRVNKAYYADIYPVGIYNKVDWEREQPCVLGDDFSVFFFKDQNFSANTISIATGLDEKEILRLTETKRYIIKLNCAPDYRVSLPLLQNEGNKSLACDKDENSIIFQFVNYLGRSRISFFDNGGRRELSIEVVPDKMDYEDDYIELTEALAERCAELLLDYSGSTSNLFSISDNEPQTLLEQFVFLRKFCFEENIQALFEEIKRNPDHILVEDEEYKPLGYGMPSKKVFSQPFKYARKWNKYTSDFGKPYYLPLEAVVSHKVYNLDTPANRFLKFALQRFDLICDELINSLNQNGAEKQIECRREAKAIHDRLQDIMRDHFFDEIGPLDMMPQNNQVLQKREGYAQVSSAYLMLDFALQLNWKGKDSVYEGESKNVALLYEYWLFFELMKIIESIEGCKVEQTEDNPFITSDKGKLIISLQEGKKSCQSFSIPQLKIKINLYYNRTFSPTDFITTRYEGSYSRAFRPDYTIAVFPIRYCRGNNNGENEAIRDGAVSYIHFDAKYRITDLTAFIKKDNEGIVEEDLELDAEKSDEVINTYRRGDLLKMHTYKDAIRRTVGSYVLYPGSCDVPKQGNQVFSLYDEILPGVGAFAIKPSISTQGEAELKKFIRALITEKVANSSRLNRMGYYSEIVLREPSSSQTARAHYLEHNHRPAMQADGLFVIGYIRADRPDDYYYFLKKNNYLETEAEFYFYYYAIKKNIVYSHHHDIANAGRFRFFTNNLSETNTYQIEPIVCSIETNELISKADLVKKLNGLGYSTSEERHHADFYYVMKVKVISSAALTKSLSVSSVNSVNGNDSFSPHSPKVLTLDQIGS